MSATRTPPTTDLNPRFPPPARMTLCHTGRRHSGGASAGEWVRERKHLRCHRLRVGAVRILPGCGGRGPSTPRQLRRAAERKHIRCRRLTGVTGWDDAEELQRDAAAAAGVTHRDFRELNALASLKKLDLCGCASLTTLPLLDALVSLEELILSGCIALTALPSLHALAALKTLSTGGHGDWAGCYSLTAVPSLDALVSLECLDLSFCFLLTTLPSLDALTSLNHRET